MQHEANMPAGGGSVDNTPDSQMDLRDCDPIYDKNVATCD